MDCVPQLPFVLLWAQHCSLFCAVDSPGGVDGKTDPILCIKTFFQLLSAAEGPLELGRSHPRPPLEIPGISVWWRTGQQAQSGTQALVLSAALSVWDCPVQGSLLCSSGTLSALSAL